MFIEPSNQEKTMPRFCVNKNAQAGGEHEVHNLDRHCNRLPLPHNQVSLGVHANCHGAVLAAKSHYSNVDGCHYCANECHTK